MSESTTLYCYIHPNRPTTLRCNNCERPICAACAVRTPTGYRCRDCVHGQLKRFDTALWYDYLTGLGTTFILSLIISVLVTAISSFLGIFMFFIALAAAGGAGVFIGNLGLWAIGKRRSRPLFFTCAAAVILGAVPPALFLIWSGNFYPLIFLGIYVVVATPAVYARISGIQMTR
jgi:hypothetical protein